MSAWDEYQKALRSTTNTGGASYSNYRDPFDAYQRYRSELLGREYEETEKERERREKERLRREKREAKNDPFADAERREQEAIATWGDDALGANKPEGIMAREMQANRDAIRRQEEAEIRSRTATQPSASGYITAGGATNAIDFLKLQTPAAEEQKDERDETLARTQRTVDRIKAETEQDGLLYKLGIKKAQPISKQEDDIKEKPVSEEVKALDKQLLQQLDQKIATGRTLTPDEEVQYSEAKLRQYYKQYPGLEKLITEHNDYHSASNAFLNSDEDDFKKSMYMTKTLAKTQDVENRIKDLTGWNDDELAGVLKYANRAQDRKDTEADAKKYEIDTNAPLRGQAQKGYENTKYSLRNNGGVENFIAWGEQFSNKPKGFGTNTDNGIYRKINNSNAAVAETTKAIQKDAEKIVSKALGEEKGKLAGDLAGRAYQSGVSAIDSELTKIPGLIVTAATGSKAAGDIVGLAPYYFKSFNNDYMEARNKGATEEEAWGRGVMGGLIEVGTELVGMDNFVNNLMGEKASKSFVKNLVKQMASEGLEEGVSDILNEFVDSVIYSKDPQVKSSFQQRIEETGSVKGAVGDFLIDMGLDTVFGALSAGPGSATTMGLGARGYRNMAQNISQSAAQASQNIQGDSTYEQSVKAQMEQYEKNPTRYVADNLVENTEDDKKRKAEVMKLAKKEAEGGKLTAGERLFIQEAIAESQASEEQAIKEGKTNERKEEEIRSDAQVPVQYRDKVSNLTEDEARARLAEAAKAGDTESFIDAMRMTRNSSYEEVAKNAEQIIADYSGMAQSHGISKEDIGNSILTEKRAYIAALMGEELDTDAMTPKVQMAYNDGKMDAIKQKTRTTIDTTDSLKTDVTTKEGKTVKLDGVFTSDGIQTSDGTVKLENLDLDENKATNKAYQFADSYQSVNLKNAFLNNIKDGQNIENYKTDFGKVFDSALAGVSLENLKKGAFRELDNEQIDNIYGIAQVERGARAANSIAEVLNGVKGNRVGKLINSSSTKNADMLNAAQLLAVVTNYDIQLVDPGTQIEITDEDGKKIKVDARGTFLKNQNRIIVRTDEFNEAVLHEIGHYVETYNKAEYDKLRNAVVDFAVEKMGVDRFTREFLGGYKNQYHSIKGQEKLQADDISGEMLNDVIPAIMGTKQGQKALVDFLVRNYEANEARTIGQQLADFMKGIGKAVKNLFGKGEYGKKYTRELAQYGDEIGQFADQFIKALDGAIQNYNKLSSEASMSVKGLDQYTGKEELNWKNSKKIVLLDSRKTFDDFIADALANKIHVKKLYFGKIKEATANRIKTIYPDVDATGYNCSLQADEVRKILLKKHGKEEIESQYGQRAITPDDLFMIPQIIAGADKIEPAGTYNGKPAIHFYKNEYTLLGVVNDTRLDIFTQTLYAKKAKNRKSLAAAVVGNADHQTSETTNSTALSNQNITQKEQNSKVKLSLSEDSTGRELSEDEGIQAAFTLNSDGRLVLTNPKELATEHWDVIRKEFNKLGYGLKNTKDAKEVYTKLAERGKNGYILNDDQDEALKKAFKISEQETSEDKAVAEARAKEDAKTAEKMFGTTSKFKLAGYLDINGKLLDFSEGQGYRVQDHREISSALDMAEDAGYSDGLIRFMNEGNIRMQEYGIDIAVKPNDAQRPVLLRFFDSLDGEVSVDFSNTNGDTVGSAEYAEGTKSKKILADIDGFFDKGEVPEGNAEYRFSLSFDEIMQAIEDNLTIEDLEEIEDELTTYASELREVVEAKPKEKKPRVKHLLRSMLGKEFDVVDGKKIAFTDDRIEKLLKMYGASNKDYAQAYLTYMSPADYLLLTTNGNDGARSFERIKNEATPLDIEELKDVYDTQPIFLDLAEKGVGRATKNEIIGHEGRHRMYALQMAGFTQIPVLVFNYDNKYNKTAIDSLSVYPQSFNEDVKYGKNNMVTLTNLQPLSRGNEDNIRQMFGSGQQADLRFSLSEDSEGRQLAEGQQRYFNKSQALDEEGRLLELYHGTEAQAFSVFNTPGIWVTPDKKLATDYAGEWNNWRNETEGYGKIKYETNGLEPEVYGDKYLRMYKVYANVTNPVSLGELNRTLPDDYAGMEMDNLGIKTEEQFDRLYDLVQVHLGDKIWQLTETEEFIDLMKELGYDGMFATENGHKTICVFDSSQLKNIDNLNPTSSDDIRFALGLEDDWVDFAEELGVNTTKSEEKAVDILAKGMEAMKNKDVDVPKLRSLALKLRNEYGSTYNVNKLTEDLEKAFAYMQTEDHVDYPTMMGILRDIARPVIEEAGEKVGEEEYKNFIDYFKGKKIKLTQTQKDNVASAFGSYGKFRNAVMPITISDNGDYTLDQIWEEIAQASGNMVDISATEGNQPQELYDALQALKPYVSNDFGGDTEDLAKDLAMRIVEEYIEGEASKQMHKQLTDYRDKLKKDYNKRLENLKGRANAEVLARNKKRAEEAKERAEVRDLKTKIKQNANKLYTWAVKPTEGKSVPHNMMVPVMQFLQAIDFVDPVVTVSEDGKYHIRLFDHMDYEDGHRKFIYKDLVGDTRDDVIKQFYEAIGRGEGTKEQRAWVEKMRGIQDIYNRVLTDKGFDDDTSMDFLTQALDAQGLAEDFNDLLERHKGQADMNNLSSAELKLIDNIISNIFHAVNQQNKAYSQPSVDIVNLAQSTMHDAEGKKIKGRTWLGEKLYKFFRIDNLNPVTFFDLLGKRGHTIYDFLRDGQNVEISDIKQASEFMEEAMGNIDKKEARKWTGDKATIHEVPLSEGTVRLTDGHIMGLYKTIRRTGGMDRIRGGIKIELREKGRKVEQKAIHLTEADIKKLESFLTPEMIAAADSMQKYMAVDCAKQGNETSKKLYGFEKFVDPTYYPYEVDKDTVATNNSSENIPMFTGIERSGFTKQLKEGATNPLVIRDIFDVFTDHVAGMAAYHGYAAPIKDAMRWMNYREREDKDGFVHWNTNKKAINDLTGSYDGVKYVKNLLLDLNKGRKSEYIGDFTSKAIGATKAAAVGGNARVVSQQWTSYFKALSEVDSKYLLTVNPVRAKKNIKRSQELSPIAWWKSKGYYETNLGQPLKEIVTGIATPAEKAKDLAMAPAGKVDDITWAFLYTAIENEQKDKFKGQKISPEEFRDAVNKRFDQVIDKTQVVDSTLHRSQYMRSPDTLNKLQTAFMAEPIKSYNMILGAYLKGGVVGAGKATARATARAVAAWTISNVLLAAMQAVWDTLRHARDDDDWWEVFKDYYINNFIDDMNPLGLLPILSTISPSLMSLFTGESTYGRSNSRFDLEFVDSFVELGRVLVKAINGEGNKTKYGIVMTALKPISQITGIPLYNLTRDIVALYNAAFDNLETTINSRSTKNNEIKKGFVSDVNKEKSENTLDEGIVDALNSGVSIYDLKGAVKSEYKNKYFDAYAEGNMEEAKAIAERAARAYARMGMSDEEIDAEINEWQEETITYALLDKAIADGEGIEEEIKHVQEGKDNDKIVKHIMDRYADTIAYEDTHETESDWRGNVEKALQAIDPTLTFDTANEEAMQKAAEKAEKDAQDAEKKGYKEEFFASVDSKNGSAGRKALDGLKAMGVDAKSAKSMVSTQYHDAWKDAKTPAEKQKAKSDWMSAYKLVCNYYGVDYKDLEKTWSDWEKKQ